MCTENVCPCLDYKASSGVSTKKLYESIDKTKLSERHRHFDASNDPRSPKVPMYFTSEK